MKKLFPVVAILCLLSWPRAASPQTPNAALVHGLGPEWKAGFSLYVDGNNTVWFFRNGDTSQNWKELVAIQSSASSLKMTPEEALEKDKASKEKKCPGATQWNVIAKDESSILYEMHADTCGGEPGGVEVARIIIGKFDWYALQYTAKTHALSPDARAEWIQTFSSATIDSVIRSFDPAEMDENVDDVIPFEMDKVIAALKAAMESQNCFVSSTAPDRIECKRPRVNPTSKQPASGGESVTAVLEANGGQTHVSITTGKGFYGRLVKSNWSTPIYDEMMKNLQTGQPAK